MSANQRTIPLSLRPVLEYVSKQLEVYRQQPYPTSSRVESRQTHSGPGSLDTPGSSLQGNYRRPLVIGISGPQGLGKTTLATALEYELTSPAFGNLKVAQFSLDDVYLPHAKQTALASLYPNNPLVQTRGQPGTHDVDLCKKTLDALCGKFGAKVRVPIYDKSRFDGAGDREFEGEFPDEGQLKDPEPLDIVIFEGWCVGFQTHHDSSGASLAPFLQQSASESAPAQDSDRPGLFQILQEHPEYLGFVDRQVADYQQIWDFFDVFVHLDAHDINWVYEWRLQQEHMMIKLKGKGKTDQEVKEFIDGYMSSYYVYVPHLRSHMSFLKDDVEGKETLGDINAIYKSPETKLGERTKGHIRLIVNRDRGIDKIVATAVPTN